MIAIGIAIVIGTEKRLALVFLAMGLALVSLAFVRCSDDDLAPFV